MVTVNFSKKHKFQEPPTIGMDSFLLVGVTHPCSEIEKDELRKRMEGDQTTEDVVVVGSQR